MKTLKKLLEKIKIDWIACLIGAFLYGAGISFWIFFGLQGIKPKLAAVFGAIWIIGDGAILLFCLVSLPIAAYIIWVKPLLSRLLGWGDNSAQKILRGN